MAEKTGRKHPAAFKPGQSGNPRGRPKGARNRTTLAAEALLDGQAQQLTQKAVELALAGDLTALRICMDRILPPMRERALQVTIPKPTPSTMADTMASLLEAVTAGEISPGEAERVGRLVTVYVQALEVTEFEARLAKLEEAQGQQ